MTYNPEGHCRPKGGAGRPFRGREPCQAARASKGRQAFAVAAVASPPPGASDRGAARLRRCSPSAAGPARICNGSGFGLTTGGLIGPGGVWAALPVLAG
jgi:hypothetical protein